MSEHSPTPYAETPYYEGFKSIRNKLRKYDTIGLIQRCVEYLHAPPKDSLDYLQRQPWMVLLLVKWALLDEAAFTRGRPVPTQRQLHPLLQSMLDLGAKVRMPTEYDHYSLFFRAMGYQQFIYQRSTSMFTLARQLLYFGNLPDTHYIRATFLAVDGIEIRRFLELSEVLLMRFMDHRTTTVNVHWFSNLSQEYPPHEVEKFLGCLSKPTEEVRQRILERDRNTIDKGGKPRSSAEYYEQTPFVDYPLIRNGKDFVCIERHVLFRCIERYVYNRLRSLNAVLFMSHFGPIFERYVQQAIGNTGLPYIAEKEIEAALKRKSNQSLIDFLIVDNDANIFVDAKAVEMAYQGKATHDSGELVRWLGTSALKAIRQAHAVMQALPESRAGDEVMQRRPHNYLIVVTYSELYVGNGRVLSEAVGIATTDALLAKFPHDVRIPLENMHFMTIREFEHLTAAVEAKRIRFTEALEMAKVADTDPSTRKFEFQQHLNEWGIGDMTPHYVRQQALNEMERLARKLVK